MHTDLKPENILLRDDRYEIDSSGYRVPLCDDIILIDFGSGVYESDYHGSIISTRQYRAPEVILGRIFC